MLISIYLHKEIKEVLEYFGDLNSVANEIVNNAMTGAIDFDILDKCPPPGDNCKYFVDITNHEYLELREVQGARSSKLSLRRLLYHFVEHELYLEWGWKPNGKLTLRTSSAVNFNTNLARVLTELGNLYKKSFADERPYILAAIKEIKQVKQRS